MKTQAASEKKFRLLTIGGKLKTISRKLVSIEDQIAKGEDISIPTNEILQYVRWMDDSAPETALNLAKRIAIASDPREVIRAIGIFQAGLQSNYKDYQIHVLKGDTFRKADPDILSRASQIVVILDNLRSAFNVGSIFRSAECLSLQSLWLCGTTATPENTALIKTAMGTQQRVHWRYFSQTEDAIRAAREAGLTTYAMETTKDAVSVFDTVFKLPLALVIGNEALGVSEDIIALCDHQIMLPVLGWKNSLNVASAFTACAYQIVMGARNASPLES
jgi:23S rRNA (guanosine2251-2'-O)-methyltransferase